MHKNFYLLVLMLFVGFSACKEEDPFESIVPDNEYLAETPVFNFNETNLALLIQAGVSDFYMFANYEADDENKYTFTSTFAKLNTCSAQCDHQLRISIKNPEAINNLDELNINELIRVDDYSFGSFGVSPIPGQISIEYTNRNGVTFQSDLADQTEESYFRITEVSDYGPNENGDPTKKLSVELTCVLKAVESEAYMEFIDAKAVISVAYPK